MAGNTLSGQSRSEKHNSIVVSDPENISGTQDGVFLPAQEEVYPEGGTQAWLAVTGSFLVYFASFGVVNSFGFFQTFYQQEYLKNYSPTAISFIGTLQITLMYLSGSVAGALFDLYGPKVSYFIGTRDGCREDAKFFSVALPVRRDRGRWLYACNIFHSAQRDLAAVLGSISPFWPHCCLRSSGGSHLIHSPGLLVEELHSQ